MKRDVRFRECSFIRLIERTCFLSSVYKLTVFDVDHDIDISTMPMAPFDAYSLTVSAFAIENATNRSVPIITFAAGEAPNNFVVSSVETETKGNYTYDSGTGPTTVEVQSSVIDIEANKDTACAGIHIVLAPCQLGLDYRFDLHHALRRLQGEGDK
jgi:hypothetical protein